MQGISAFLYHYIECLYSLRLPGGGAIAPLALLNPPLKAIVAMASNW